MTWLSKNYRCFIFLCDPKSENIWEYKSWNIVSILISSFLQNDINSIALRTSQISLKEKKEIKFGRLKLNDESNRKWTHNSPITKDLSCDWMFQDVEGWFPSWSNCEKMNESPDFYFSIDNEKSGRLTKPVIFNPIILLSFSIEKYNSYEIKNLINNLKDFINPILLVERERKWAIQSAIGFSYAINDITLRGLFKNGDVHERPIDLNTFSEEWILYTN